MAYIRTRGNQLALVHGERDTETGKVQQRVLFTIYSQAEAQEAIGQGARHLRAYLEDSFPSIRFDWKRIRKELQENLAALPQEYSYGEERRDERFREHLLTFAKQLMQAAPQVSPSASDRLTQHQEELQILADLIHLRLKSRPIQKTNWSPEPSFYSRLALQRDAPPPDIREMFEESFERGDGERLRAGFQMLADCFADYAEGHNYLGVIDLERGEYDTAIQHFQRAMTIARKRFPKRVAKDRLWTDLDSRPYVRALRNLAFALNMVGRHEEALDSCVRLEVECGDNMTAAACRATIALNTGDWKESSALARKVCEGWPSESFVAALALRESGEGEEALVYFLHGALNLPLVARWLVGKRPRKSEIAANAEEFDQGRDLLQSLSGYLLNRGPKMRRYFKHVLLLPPVDAMLDEVRHARRRRVHQRPKGLREAFDRESQMTSLKYARERARELSPKLPARG
jgi:tetratricopeptide (TPR) repeat protein